MEKILNEISSPTWLFTTLFASFLVNIAAAYAKPYFDNWWANRSEKKRKSLEAEKEKFKAEVEEVLAEGDGIVLLVLQQIKGVLGCIVIITLIPQGVDLLLRLVEAAFDGQVRTDGLGVGANLLAIVAAMGLLQAVGRWHLVQKAALEVRQLRRQVSTSV